MSAPLLLTLAWTLACGPSAGVRTEDATLRVGFGIGNSARTSVRNLTDLLYVEPLFARTWDGRQVPRLVANWAWEQDGRQLRLQLKPGVFLHDGTPLSPDLVRQILTPSDGPRELGFEHVEDVRTVADDTVLITLTRPDPFLLNGLADRRMVHPDKPDVGTGPFVLSTRKPDVEARRFERYHGGASALAGVKIITYDTPRSAWAAFMRDEVDAVQEVNAESVEFMTGSSTAQTFPSLQPFQIALVFNVNSEMLKQLEVRRAIAEAIDRPALLKRVLNGRGRLADAPIWPNHWAYVPHPKRWEYSPESAKARLRKAGIPMRGGEPGSPSTRFALRCMVYNEDPLYERLALMIQRQLFDVGIDLQIELVDLGTIGKRALAGEFETYLMRSNTGRSMDFTYRFWMSDLPVGLAMQSSGYTGADHALNRLRNSMTEAETRNAVADLASRFYEDVPAVFIAWLEVTRAVDSDFDVGPDRQDPLFSLWQWRRKDRPGS